VDVFGYAVAAGGDLMRAAAIDAAFELGMFADDRPWSIEELADRAKLGKGRKRLRALVDVLVAIGALARASDGRLVAGNVPLHVPVPRDGWGRMVSVLRTNKALNVEGGEIELRYHQHLLVAGAPTAAELAPQLPAGALVDFGGGAGTYTRAYLAAHPGSRATLVDFREVIELARHELADLPVDLVASEITMSVTRDDFDVALLANVVHLHGAPWCERIVARAARAVRSGGVVVVKELAIDDARTGPIESLLFALNMALYTGDGDVYTPTQITGWLAAAGLVDIVALPIADGIAFRGTKP